MKSSLARYALKWALRLNRWSLSLIHISEALCPLPPVIKPKTPSYADEVEALRLEWLRSAEPIGNIEFVDEHRARGRVLTFKPRR